MRKTVQPQDKVARLTAERDEAVAAAMVARETAQALVVAVVQTRDTALREAEDILRALMEQCRREATERRGQDTSCDKALELLEIGLRTVIELRINPER